MEQQRQQALQQAKAIEAKNLADAAAKQQAAAAYSAGDVDEVARAKARLAALFGGGASGQALGDANGAAGHRAMVGADQIGPLAGEGLQQGQHGLRQLGIHRQRQPGGLEQLSRCGHRLRPVLGHGSSGAE